MGRTACVHRGQPRRDGHPAVSGDQQEGGVPVGAQLPPRGPVRRQVRVGRGGRGKDKFI